MTGFFVEHIKCRLKLAGSDAVAVAIETFENPIVVTFLRFGNADQFRLGNFLPTTNVWALSMFENIVSLLILRMSFFNEKADSERFI